MMILVFLWGHCYIRIVYEVPLPPWIWVHPFVLSPLTEISQTLLFWLWLQCIFSIVKLQEDRLCFLPIWWQPWLGQQVELTSLWSQFLMPLATVSAGMSLLISKQHSWDDFIWCNNPAWKSNSPCGKKNVEIIVRKNVEIIRINNNEKLNYLVIKLKELSVINYTYQSGACWWKLIMLLPPFCSISSSFL